MAAARGRQTGVSGCWPAGRRWTGGLGVRSVAGGEERILSSELPVRAHSWKRGKKPLTARRHVDF